MKTVIEMARKAGFDGMGQRVVSPVIEGSDLAWLLERFAELIRSEEREACVKVCEELDLFQGYGEAFAAAIRSRSSEH